MVVCIKVYDAEGDCESDRSYECDQTQIDMIDTVAEKVGAFTTDEIAKIQAILSPEEDID